MVKRSKSKIKDLLCGVRVYDNPQFADRYTVILPNGDVFGMSDNPLSPNGFNQYNGTIGMDKGLTIANIEKDSERVNKSKLSNVVKQAIMMRMYP